MKTKPFLKGLFWSLVALALVFHAAGGWYFSGVIIEDAFLPNPSPIEVSEGNFDLVEAVYTTPLGDMDAWHLDAPGSIWVIHVHGLNSTPAAAEHLFGPLQEAGYPQLSIAHRNDHGQPEDPSGYHQYGVTEWEDMRAALDYAKANGAVGTVFFGYSTGASHSLANAYRHHIDDIRGLIFDAPNIDLGDSVNYAASQRSFPVLGNVPITLAWTAKFLTSLRIGVNWRSIDYVRRADSALRVPVLVFHGTEDATIPLSQSERFAEASPELVRLVTVEGAGHSDNYDVDPETYVAEVLAFLDRFR